MNNVSPAQVVDAPVYSTEFQEFLSSKASRLAEILQDYNRFLSLVFIPSSKRDDTDTHPFAILDSSPWHAPNIIKHLSEREVDDPAHVLQWLFEGDLSKHGLSEIMARSRAKEFAEKLLATKREAEIAEERQELTTEIIKGGRNRLNDFRHGGKIFNDAGARDVSQTIH